MTRKEILEDARRCVCGDREEDYGSPEDNFARIGGLWSAYLGVPIKVWDVAIMLALMKIGRIGGGQVKMDNWIDLAGYAACGGEIQSGSVTPAAETSAPAPKVEGRPVTEEGDSENPIRTYSPVVVVLNGDDWTWLPQEFLPTIEQIKANGSNDLVIHPDCTVEIVTLLNGEESAAWWRNDKPPVNLGGIWVEDDGDE
jgi:hypothetical protein